MKIQTTPDPITYLLTSYPVFPSNEVLPHTEHIVSIFPTSAVPLDSTANNQFSEPVLSTNILVAVSVSCGSSRSFLPTEPIIRDLLSRLEKGHALLDAGCRPGQDLRTLVFDGAPSASNLYGLDISPAFFDLGFELFRDRHTCDHMARQRTILQIVTSIVITESIWHLLCIISLFYTSSLIPPPANFDSDLDAK